MLTRRTFLLSTALSLPRFCRAADEPARHGGGLVIRGGTVYDGTATPPVSGDVVVRGDRIVSVGKAGTSARGMTVIDAAGLAVAPGFINMLSWSNESLIADGHSQSEIREGVTTQIMGEGWSMGPVNDAIKRRMKAEQTDVKYDIEWKTLAGYLHWLERRGIAQNVASYIGAATVRGYVLGLGNRKANTDQMVAMHRLVEQEMKAGALGIGSALEYAPAYYADTHELIELCKAAGRHRGKYISHMRSEGARLIEAIQELIRISREADIPAEISMSSSTASTRWSPSERMWLMYMPPHLAASVIRAASSSVLA